MADITKPILLDETGQAIKNAILEVKTAIESQNSGGGGGGEADSGTFELIDEITTTEGLTSLSRKTHPDGTPYNFKAVYVAMIVPAGTAAGTFNINCYYNGTRIGLMGISGINATSQRFVNYYTHQLHGIWETRGGACGGNYGTGDGRYFKDVPNLVVDFPVINRVDIPMVTSGVVFPVGTNIKIYGVRA